MSDRYRHVHALAVRLLRCEVIELHDEHGRLWVGTASSLALRLPGSASMGTVLDAADAFEVAWGLAAPALS